MKIFVNKSKNVVDKQGLALYNIASVIFQGGVIRMSICPKNKSSKARRDKRRANWKMSAPALVKCSKCGELMVPHRVCKNCGSYNKKEIISAE
jgi:large subunit ribosomal protein L32